MSKVRSVLKGMIPLALAAGMIAGVVLLVMSLLGGDDDKGESQAVALGPVESSWLPGQPSLASYPEFNAVLSRAELLANERLALRKRALEELERRKLEAKQKADADARRKYEEAKRRAQELYRKALAEAKRQREEQERKLAAARARARELERRRQELLKVKPGEECKLENVRDQFACRTGKLPDTPPKKRKKK